MQSNTTFFATAGGLFRLLGILSFAGGPASAAELVDIVATRPCSAIAGDRIAASGNCTASADHKKLSVTLTAKQVDLSKTPGDAGSVSFDLPDGVSYPGSASRRIAVDGLMLYNETLAPEVWRVNAGSTLEVKLVNRLSAGETGATNLHTHGLLVSPDLDTKGSKALEPVGDTVYVCTIPEGETTSSPSSKNCSAHGAYYGNSTSEMNYRLALPADHPEGLFWYHPHVHMNARTQVGAGLSGLIFVQGATGSASGGTRATNGPQPTERFLMLKDHQLGSVSGTDPAIVKAGFLPVGEHDAGLCGAGTTVHGACFADDKGWLFTVNGQLYPHMTIKSGEREIWRIANTSADMTYDLALIARDSGRPLRMQLLARDGIAAAQEGPDSAILVERVLMMPSSRIEVAIDRAASEGLFDSGQPLEAVLKTYGYYTGGDAWPAVELAGVTFEATPAAVTMAKPRVVRHHATAGVPSVAKAFEPLRVTAWTPSASPSNTAAPPARAIKGDVRAPGPAAPSGSDHMAHAGAVNQHPLPLPSAEECKPLQPGEERLIVLAIEKTDRAEMFKIGAARAKRQKLTPAQWNDLVQKTIDTAAQFGEARSPLLCAHAGTTETWTVVNKPYKDNFENHNFHVHQTKFEIVDVQDPQNRIAPPRGGAAAKRLVDNYPVPIGGSIRLKVRFSRNQVGGRFVLHCHILEHEDKGMMAAIEVMSK
ncbi:multicopper oxidase family protein [Bradyrhizobium symbiodeficiens]|uniref:multicopper oxidase family protein n=1 Tax=Bradyrhizobium symbiodeficiens TaxID=1404367 RepID=UPI00140FCAE7|nr:multicopper oxidase family protein [Bradyrhizobium symbiodeficiens]QIP02982.1 multicopper oxidase family protein [Bradyrhizobium symbiodeficiens]